MSFAHFLEGDGGFLDSNRSDEGVFKHSARNDVVLGGLLVLALCHGDVSQ